MTTGGEPFAISIKKEANTSNDRNITFVATPNTHYTKEPLNATSELNPNDPVLQFIVQNFDPVNTMYTAFIHARKEVPHRSLPTSGNPSGEPWNSDSEEAHLSKSLGKTFVENDEVEPIPANTLDANNTKGKDGLKVPANLKAYDGMSDPDDHLTVFMGTMDIHKLLKPVWCRFFPITLCGATRFWAEDANNENRLREPRQGNRETKQHATYKDIPRRPKDKFVSCTATRYNEHHKALHNPFTTLIKSPTEIFATTEGKSVLWPPPKMFTPTNKRDITKYCEFHKDHGHDTNDCIDLRKEIEICVRNGRLSHLVRGAKTENNSQAVVPLGSRNGNRPQIE
ncbi:hypothetical protein Tco_1121368 [Tanacetum coccineum]|uniref:Reverse transcriptase domain-containing protein n=1 Tax=Tanacetum coccineum TaxID=301880 RepID=A0ABQ5J0F6_9ASTR